MSEQAQRRQSARPNPPKADWLVHLDRLIAHALTNVRHHWVGRITFSLLLLLCLGAVWWSLNERLPLVEGSKAYIQRVNLLQTDVELLKNKWNPGRMMQDNDALASHEQALMPNMEDLAAWLQSTVLQAKTMGLHFDYKIGIPEAAHQSLIHVRLLPIDVTLEAEQDEFPLRAALDFFKSMTSDGWHIDISQAEMNGDEEGLEEIRAIVRVWMKSTPELELFISEARP